MPEMHAQQDNAERDIKTTRDVYIRAYLLASLQHRHIRFHRVQKVFRIRGGIRITCFPVCVEDVEEVRDVDEKEGGYCDVVEGDEGEAEG